MRELFSNPANLPALIICGVAILVIVVIVIVLCSSSSSSEGRGARIRKVSRVEPVEVETSEKSIVTVRRVGNVTRIHVEPMSESDAQSLYYEKMQARGRISFAPLPAEDTKADYPTEYAEYMNPATSAIRKYEILSMLYEQGYSLPYLPDLSDAYRREVEEINARTQESARRIEEGEGGFTGTMDIDTQLALQSIPEIPPVYEPVEVDEPDEADFRG